MRSGGRVVRSAVGSSCRCVGRRLGALGRAVSGRQLPRRRRRRSLGVGRPRRLGAASASSAASAPRRPRRLGSRLPPRRRPRPARRRRSAGPPVGLELGAQRLDRAGGLGQRRLEQRSGTGQRRLHRAGELGQQDLARLEVGEPGRARSAASGAPSSTPPLMTSSGMCLGEVTQALRRLDRVALDEGDGRRTDEQVVERVDPGVARGDLGQRVLHHGVRRDVTERRAQLGELGDGETAVLGQHGALRAAELVRELGDGCCLVGPGHGSPIGGHRQASGAGNRATPTRTRRPGAGAGRRSRPGSTRSGDRAHTCAGRPAYRGLRSPEGDDQRSLATDRAYGSRVGLGQIVRDRGRRGSSITR